MLEIFWQEKKTYLFSFLHVTEHVSLFCSWLLKGHKNFLAREKNHAFQHNSDKEGTVWKEDGICGLDLHLCSPSWKGPSAWGEGSNTRKGSLSLPKLLLIAKVLCLRLRKRRQKGKRQKLMLQTCRQILHYPCIFHFAKEFGIWVPYSTTKTASNF